jgi:hypothetical protein
LKFCLLWVMLLWIFSFTYLCIPLYRSLSNLSIYLSSIYLSTYLIFGWAKMYSFDNSLEVVFLSHKGCMCSPLVDTTKCMPKLYSTLYSTGRCSTSMPKPSICFPFSFCRTGSMYMVSYYDFNLCLSQWLIKLTKLPYVYRSLRNLTCVVHVQVSRLFPNSI